MQVFQHTQSPDVWTSHVPIELHHAVSKALPGWLLLNGHADKATGLLPEAENEQNVVLVNAAANSPVVFARRVTIPGDGNPRLRLRIGHPQGANWHVRVDAGRKTLWDQTFDAKFANQPWKDVNVDLTAVKGQTVWLVVRGRHNDPAQPVATLWKHLDIVE